MLPALLLGALKFAPAIFSAGKDIVAAVTGEAVPADAARSPEALTDYVGALPEDQQAAIAEDVIAAKVRYQELDTQRFVAMNDGDADKLRASARPQIALRAMAVITLFARAFTLIMVATTVEWLCRAGFAFAGKPFPVTDSLWSLIADAAPVAEMIWAPLIASFWVSADIIKKYMGCRERDKAAEYELQHGKPLNATQATIEAAGSGIAGIVKAWKGR